MMDELTPDVARRIVDTVGAHGTPPEYGFQFFTAGLDPYLKVIEEEYLASYIRDGGSAFKMVVGVYGGGKTHLLYCVREMAWKHSFVVSYVRLSPTECPFHRLDLVYRAIAENVVPPQSPTELLRGYEHGLPNLLRAWYGERLQYHQASGRNGEALQDELATDIKRIGDTESISFVKAIKTALDAVAARDDGQFDTVSQWLKGEGYDSKFHKRLGILERIDKSTAFKMTRSLVQLIRHLGFSGLVICFDETERALSLTAKAKELHLSNLRELIDECGQTAFQGAMLFYAVPDETFLEGRTMVYEALRQRVDTVFGDFNPSGVKIFLDATIRDPKPFLQEVGQKLAAVYGKAYQWELPDRAVQETIDLVADWALGKRFGDVGYKRLFVQRLVTGLHHLKQKGEVPTKEDLD